MSKQFTKLKIYELGGGVAFQTETGAVPFEVIPKGGATMKPWGVSGFVFEKVVTGDVIAFVDSFDDLLDSAGVAWGVSQAAVFTAVGGFFFELGGGGSVTAASVTYDNSVSGLAATDVQAAIDEIVVDIENGTVGYYPVGYLVNFHDHKEVVNQNVFGGRIYGSVDYIRSTVKIDRLRIAVATPSVGTGVTGIYKYNGVTWDLIVQAPANINLATAIEQEIVFASELTLEKGIYAFVVFLQNDTIFTSTTNNAVNLIFGWANTNASNHNSAVDFVKAYDGVLNPNVNFNLISAFYGTFPHILYKITG
jgi:hypothetical protein